MLTQFLDKVPARADNRFLLLTVPNNHFIILLPNVEARLIFIVLLSIPTGKCSTQLMSSSDEVHMEKEVWKSSYLDEMNLV